MENSLELFCNRIGHEGQQIGTLCTEPNCKEQRCCCSICIIEYHSSHANYIQNLKELQILYKPISNKDTFFDEFRNKLIKALNQFQQVIINFYPTYPDQLDLSTLNNLGTQISNQQREFNFARIQETLESAVNEIEKKLNEIISQQQNGQRNNSNLKLNQENLNHCKYEDAPSPSNQSPQFYEQNSSMWNNKGKMYIELGRELYQLKKYEESIECYDQAINFQPNNSILYKNKAQSLIKLCRYKDALKCSIKGLEINPNHSNSWNVKGNALSGLNNHQEALKCYQRAVEIQPNHIKLFNLADTLEELEQQEEALKYYRLAFKMNPKDEDIIDGIQRLEKKGFK